MNDRVFMLLTNQKTINYEKFTYQTKSVMRTFDFASAKVRFY
jgi:hypothetical protein